MKNILLILTILISLNAYSNQKEDLKKLLSEPVTKNFVDQNFKNLSDHFEKFSEVKNLDKTDVPLVTNILKVLVQMDELDESRSFLDDFTTSYANNKKIYLSAVKKLSKSEQRTATEFIKIWNKLNSKENN